MRSSGANTKIRPGPLASGSRRPRRKITPRSYSARILIELSRYIPKMIITIVVKPKPSSIWNASEADCIAIKLAGM